MNLHDTKLDQFTKLRGGPKHMWLENHRDMILTFYDEFGETTTKTTFNLKGETLHNLLVARTSQRKCGRLSKADKALAQAEILRADLQEIRKEVKSLKDLFERFQQSVGEQLVTKFFIPMLQAGIKVDADLNMIEEDKLRIDNIDLKQLAVKTRKNNKEKVGYFTYFHTYYSACPFPTTNLPLKYLLRICLASSSIQRSSPTFFIRQRLYSFMLCGYRVAWSAVGAKKTHGNSLQ